MQENNMLAQKQKPQPPRNVSDLIKRDGVSKRIEDLLGKKAQSFCSTLVAISRQTHLEKADPASVLGAAITAATLDLPINQNLGFAYIVPYKTEAQFQMGYKGYIQLALRSGQYKALNDAVIPHDALQSYNELTGELIVDFSKATEGEPDGYAFYFELTNGFSKTVFWSHARVLEHAKRFSQAFRSGYGPWKDDFSAMALKTVVKNTLSKYGILSIEMQNAVVTDQAVISGVDEHGVPSYVDNPEETDNSDGKQHAPAGDDLAEPSIPKATEVEEVKGPESKEKKPAAEEVSEEKKEPSPDGLTPVADLSKAALLAEARLHKDKPYFAEAKSKHVDAEFNLKECPVSSIRDVVIDLRAASKA